MTTTAPVSEHQTSTINEDIVVLASLEQTFQSLVAQWGFVQSIKRPALLEIWGPLFMSTAATSNLLYRLSETPEGTLIKFTHTLVGPFPEEHRSRLGSGWTALHARVRKAAEAAAR